MVFQIKKQTKQPTICGTPTVEIIDNIISPFVAYTTKNRKRNTAKTIFGNHTFNRFSGSYFLGVSFQRS